MADVFLWVFGMPPFWISLAVITSAYYRDGKQLEAQRKRFHEVR